MIIEGPVATIMAATLAALGAFNVFIVLIFSISGDIIGDVILYWLGYRYGISFVNKIGKYIGITEKLVLKMEKYFERHGRTTIFAVKSTTGLCWATFTAAGIVKMDFNLLISRRHRLERISSGDGVFLRLSLARDSGYDSVDRLGGGFGGDNILLYHYSL